MNKVPAMDYTLSLDQFQLQVRNQPRQAWLHQPVNRKRRTWTWAQADEDARKIANALVSEFEPGTRIGILS